MKLYIIILSLLICLCGLPVFAQSGFDSLSRTVSDVRFQNSSKTLDSIQSAFYKQSDSLRSAYSHMLSTIDSGASSLQSRLDSLTSLKLPTEKITNALDSVSRLREKTITSLNEEIQSLKDHTTEKLKRLNVPPALSEKLRSVTSNVDGFNIPAEKLDIPSLNLPGSVLGKMGAPNLNSPLPEINNSLPGVSDLSSSLPNVVSAQEIKDVAGKVSDVTDVTEKIGGYNNDMKELAQGDLSQANELPTTAESKVAELSGVSDINNPTNAFGEYKALAAQAKDPDALKEQVVEKVKEAATSHFAGKERQLHQAMERVSKYKKHYASVNDVAKLPEKRPNEMKGKSFIERLVPGIALQIQKEGEDLMVDFNAYAGYRFTRRINAGLGWNQRIAYDTKKDQFNSKARIYGPRAYGEYNLWKGFFPRAEVEVMNAFVPPFIYPTTIDSGSRQWVWGAFVGIKKEYRFLKGVKGTALVMLRLFDPQHKSPYADVVNARFGFEFPVRRKAK